MGDFKLPPSSIGSEVSTVGLDPRQALSFDDEVTEVTTGGGLPAETTGTTINRQFGIAAGEPPPGGDSAWVGAADVSTKHARDIEGQGLAHHAQKFDAKIKARNAAAAEKRKKEKELAAKAFKQRMASQAADRVRMMQRVAESGKTNDKAKAMRADNAKSLAAGSVSLRTPASASGSTSTQDAAPAPAAAVGISAPSGDAGVSAPSGGGGGGTISAPVQE